jgi:hypothetical protein
MLRVMERLNYHHLLYFWMVAREGTMARDSDAAPASPRVGSTGVKATNVGFKVRPAPRFLG